MHLTETLHLPVSAPDAVRMYADPGYAQLRRRELEAQEADSRISGSPEGAFTATTTLRMPTEQVPDIVRRFVGQSVQVRETQEWSAPEADGSRRGTIRVEVIGAPATMTGRTRLVPAGDGASRLEIDGDLVAKVPLIGRKIEQTAVPYIGQVLRREERSAAAWAAQGS